jgi:hypothetical protein
VCACQNNYQTINFEDVYCDYLAVRLLSVYYSLWILAIYSLSFRTPVPIGRLLGCLLLFDLLAVTFFLLIYHRFIVTQDDGYKGLVSLQHMYTARTLVSPKTFRSDKKKYTQLID